MRPDYPRVSLAQYRLPKRVDDAVRKDLLLVDQRRVVLAPDSERLDVVTTGLPEGGDDRSDGRAQRERLLARQPAISCGMRSIGTAEEEIFVAL